jgi:hypothetical protein
VYPDLKVVKFYADGQLDTVFFNIFLLLVLLRGCAHMKGKKSPYLHSILIYYKSLTGNSRIIPRGDLHFWRIFLIDDGPFGKRRLHAAERTSVKNHHVANITSVESLKHHMWVMGWQLTPPCTVGWWHDTWQYVGDYIFHAYIFFNHNQ